MMSGDALPCRIDYGMCTASSPEVSEHSSKSRGSSRLLAASSGCCTTSAHGADVVTGCLKNGCQKVARYGLAERSGYGQSAKGLSGSAQQRVAQLPIRQATIVDQKLLHRTREDAFTENRASTLLQGAVHCLLRFGRRFLEDDEQITRLHLL